MILTEEHLDKKVSLEYNSINYKECLFIKENNRYFLLNNTIPNNNNHLNKNIYKYSLIFFDLMSLNQRCKNIKLLEENNMFKKDDYIVTLDIGSFVTDCAKNNYCFKQKFDSEVIYPAVDLFCRTVNSNDLLTFDKTKKLKDWRYATKEEVAEYDRLGKPFDVTTLTKITLQEIQEKYSIGTKFKSLDDNIIYEVLGKIIQNAKGSEKLNDYYCFCTKDNKQTYKSVYKNGEWAEIIEEAKSEETKPNLEIFQYIEATKDYNDYFKTGIIYEVLNCENISSSKVQYNIEVNDFDKYKDLYVNLLQNNFKALTKKAYELQEKREKIINSTSVPNNYFNYYDGKMDHFNGGMSEIDNLLTINPYINILIRQQLKPENVRPYESRSDYEILFSDENNQNTLDTKVNKVKSVTINLIEPDNLILF